jgi:hypothetical protein
VDNQGGDGEDADVLPLPIINYGDISREREAEHKA